MAFDNLKTFMVNRLMDLDPTLSDATGSDIYTKVIDPLVARLGVDPSSVDIETFIVQRMRDEFPELDVVSPGSVLVDVLVSPMRLLLEPLRREIEQIRAQQSLADYQSLSEVEMNALLSNLLVERVGGAYAFGTVRVFFTRSGTVNFTSLVTFSTASGLNFIPDGVATFVAADFTRSGDLYYVDVPVRSAEPSEEFNLSIGAIRYHSGLTGVSRVTNITSITGGISAETNEDFLTRAERSLSERSLNTRRGIESDILSNFSSITSVEVVGYGEVGMDRDIIHVHAEEDGDESIGPMIFSSARWRTHTLATFASTDANENALPAATVDLPFTNTVLLSGPSGQGWGDHASLLEDIMNNAKYLRVADAGAEFTASVLSRVREIESKKLNGNNLYIKCKDFEIYPQAAGHAIDTTISASTIRTDGAHHGYNQRSIQGSEWALSRSKNNVDYVAGAPLPVTDHVTTTFSSTEVPSSAILGRDFLFTAAKTAFSDTDSPGALGRFVSSNTRLYPINRFFSSSDIGVGRIDSFLLSKDRTDFSGKTGFVFNPLDETILAGDGISVKAFGSPSFSDHPDEQKKYDGYTVGDVSRSPGCTLVGAVGVAGAVHRSDGIAETCTLALHKSQNSWAAQGVVAGDFISCSLFASGFDGKLADAGLPANLLWHGWGRITQVGSPDVRKLQVSGMDWTPLARSSMESFNPPASGMITVNDSNIAPLAVHGGLTPPDESGMRVAFDDGALVNGHVDAVPLLTAPGTGDGGTSSAKRASAIISFANEWVAGSSVTVEFGLANHAPHQVDYVINGNASASDAATDLAGLINANNPNFMEYTSAEANGASVVVTSTRYGAFINRRLSAGTNWGIGIAVSGADAALVNAPEGFSGGVDPTPAELAREIAFRLSLDQDFKAYVTPVGDEASTTVWVERALRGAAGNSTVMALTFSQDGIWGSSNSFATFSGWVNNSRLGGGFSSGFGPSIEVKDEVAPPSPAPNNLAKRFSFALANSPVREKSVVLEYTDGLGNPAVSVNDSASEGSLTGPNDSFTGTIDYSAGIVSLVFAAPVPATAIFEFDYEYLRLPYRLSWTVYGGSVEGITPSGDVYSSYTDLSFPPAYKFSHLFGEYPGSVNTRHPSGYHGFGWDPFPMVGFLWWSRQDSSVGTAYGTGSYDSRLGVWLRLGKSFTNSLPSVGSSGAAASFGQEVTWLSRQPYTNQEALVEAKADEWLFTRDRYNTYISKKISPNGADQPILLGPTSLPFLAGAKKIDGHGADATLDASMSSLSNLSGDHGFLIPHPMGPDAHAVYTALADPEGAVWDPAAGTGDQPLDGQNIQLFSKKASELSSAAVVVSGIPGSVPFPDQFPGDFVIRDNQVHIGGMTDVYLNNTSPSVETTDPIRLNPSEVISSNQSPEVLLSASDGVVGLIRNQFTSAAIGAYLAGVYGNDNPKVVVDMSVEIIDPVQGLSPTFFRIFSCAGNVCEIDGIFPADIGNHTNLKFRLMSGCTTSLSEPLILLQQGSDLSSIAGSLVVSIPSGVSFIQDPSLIPIYLGIDSGDSKGEYLVTGRGNTNLVLETSPHYSAESLSYRVYIKQVGGTALPFTRVQSVKLDDSDTVGVSVPYRHPVDVVSSDFSGINDDPLSGADLGNATLENVVIDGVTIACLTMSDTEDMRLKGVVKYDAVRLDKETGDNRYWYVTGFQTEGGITNRRLILDRAGTFSAGIVTPDYTIGHPAIGTATVVFQDRTMFEVGPETVFQYTGANSRVFKFRPSPAEESVLYKSPQTLTYSSIGDDGVQINMSESVYEATKHEIKPGDKVDVVSRVLSSDGFSEATQAHENLNVGGRTLLLEVGGVGRAVTFSGANPMTLDDVVADINRQLSGVMAATVDSAIVNGVTHRYLKLSSYSHVVLKSGGSIGVVSDLKFNLNSQRSVDNKYYGVGAADLVDRFTVESVNENGLTIREDAGLVPIQITNGTTEEIFIKVSRPMYQRVYPSEMTDYLGGLYSSNIKLVSYDPNEKSGLVTDLEQLTVSGHRSLGYEIVVENNNYTFSSAEKPSIRVTPFMLDSSASSMSPALSFTLPGASVVVEYDWVPSVLEVQNYLLQPSVRVVCNNPLARHFFPAYPRFSVEYNGDLTTDAVRLLLQEFLVNLYPNSPLEVFDLAALLSKNGVGYMKMPQEVGFLVHDENRRRYMVRSQDKATLSNRSHIMGDMTGVVLTGGAV